MTIRTFWNILIKILGIWIALNCLSLVPQYVSSIFYSSDYFNFEIFLYGLATILGIIIFYYLILRLFIFKTNWIIDRLKLDKNFSEEKIDLNIGTQYILRIACIVLGGLILVDSIPDIFRTLFSYYQDHKIFKKETSSVSVVYNIVKSIIAYLLLNNSKYRQYSKNTLIPKVTINFFKAEINRIKTAVTNPVNDYKTKAKVKEILN